MKRTTLSLLIVPTLVAVAFLTLAAPLEAAGPGRGGGGHVGGYHAGVYRGGVGHSGYRPNYGYRNYNNYGYRSYSGYYSPNVWYGTYPYTYDSGYYPSYGYSSSYYPSYGYSPYYLQP